MVEVNTLLFFCKLWFYAFSFGIASPNYLMTFIAISSSCPMQLFVIVNFCFSIWLKLLYICDAGSWLETWQEDFLMHMIYVHGKTWWEDIDHGGAWWYSMFEMRIMVAIDTCSHGYIGANHPEICVYTVYSIFFVSWFIYHQRFAMRQW